MIEESVKDFIDACDDLVECKYLVAEYKIQKMLKALAESEPVCSLIGEFFCIGKRLVSCHKNLIMQEEHREDRRKLLASAAERPPSLVL